MFFAALIVAPWFYGGTTAVGIMVINWILAAALLFWTIKVVLNRRLPKFPRMLLILVLILLVIGFWMTINARSIYDSEFATFMDLINFAPGAPGSVDYAISFAWIIRGALLLMSILFVVDLSRSENALLQLWQTIVLSGGSVSLLGLLQKATNAAAIFWQAPIEGYGKTFFASYYYHANAGAFLNLTLPLSAGLAVRAFATPTTPSVRSLWLLMFLLNLAAIVSNTSRGAQLIAGLIILALFWQLGPRVFRGLSRGEKNVALAGVAAIFLVLYAIAQASHLEQPISHWKQIEDISQDARWTVTRVALDTVPKVGVLGLGPGTFRSVFPSLNKDHLASGGWRFLHEDYLQTVIEWGWLGSALWALLFFGGIFVAINNVRKREAREWSLRRRLILQMSILALAGVALHALVDFPLQIESIQLYVATYLGLCWSSVRWRSG